MKLAAVRAIAELAQAETSEQVALAYGGETVSFGPEYLIPRPFDPRLIARIAPAVAKAAMDSGVATRPIADLDAYRAVAQPVRLPLRPDHEAAVHRGEGARRGASSTPRARTSACCARCRSWSTKGLARPILIGRPQVIEQRLERLGLRMRPGKDFELVNPGVRPALPRLLDDLPPAHRAQGRVAGIRARRDAPPAHADRRHDDVQGRGRRHAVRHLRHARDAPAVHRRRSSACGRACSTTRR